LRQCRTPAPTELAGEHRRLGYSAAQCAAAKSSQSDFVKRQALLAFSDSLPFLQVFPHPLALAAVVVHSLRSPAIRHVHEFLAYQATLELLMAREDLKQLKPHGR
jgi:hypothetical protein